MAKRFVFAPLLDDAWTWKVTRLVVGATSPKFWLVSLKVNV